jgi:hypothetical protein
MDVPLRTLVALDNQEAARDRGSLHPQACALANRGALPFTGRSAAPGQLT